MILTINKFNCNEYSDLVDQSFKIRHSVFKEKLGWDVNSNLGRENDEFDDLKDTVYLLHINTMGEVDGCVRLLPMSGKNMLNDVFSVLLDGQEAPNEHDTWESTRFAVSPKCDDSKYMNLITNRLLDAICEVGLLNYVRKIVTVTDLIMERALRQRGFKTERIGSVHQFGICKAVAGYFDLSYVVLKNIRIKSGFISSQLIDYNEIDKVA